MTSTIHGAIVPTTIAIPFTHLPLPIMQGIKICRKFVNRFSYSNLESLIRLEGKCPEQVPSFR